MTFFTLDSHHFWSDVNKQKKKFHTEQTLGILVDKDDLIKYQLLIIYGLLLMIFTYQPTVDKTIRAINQLLIE